MPTKKPNQAEQHREALTNLGKLMTKAVDGPGIIAIRGIAEIELEAGTLMYGALKAGLKAPIPGRQRDRNVTTELTAMLKAVNRYLSRKTAHF